MKRSVLISTLILSSTLHMIQAKELLIEVNNNKVEKLTEYNRNFLLRELYLSSRHRIIKVDTKILLEEQGEFTITPFNDIDPIPVKTVKAPSIDDYFGNWIGKKQFSWYENLTSPVESISKEEIISTLSHIHFFMMAYDVDPELRATESFNNKFKFSEYWEIDDFGIPTLGMPDDGGLAVAGPPPETPADIEEHRKLKTLKKRDFYSVWGQFKFIDINNGNMNKTFRIMPLKFTPKYSVIYELDPDKTYMHPPLCDLPGRPCVDNRSELDKSKLQNHKIFLDSIPKEDKPVLEDLN